MEFRVLGPLEVRRHGKTPPIGGATQRAILVTLLLRANHTVTLAQLAESAWVEPPQALGSNVRTYMSRLRAAFAAAGEAEARLVTESNGYRLVVHPGELDVAEFEALVAEADGMPAGDPARIAERLGRAIRLWRGEAFADVTVGPLLQMEAARLEDLRLTATERWADAALAAGWHEDVAIETGNAIRATPLRERLREQYMLALYRCGRQAEALACYREFYRLLDDELGIAPGRALERLHSQILAADPALDLPPGPVPAVAPTGRPAEPPGRVRRARRLRVAVVTAVAAVLTLGTAGTAWTLVSAGRPAAHRGPARSTGGVPAGRVRLHPATAPGLCIADGHVRDQRYTPLVAIQEPCDQVAPLETTLEPRGGDAYRIVWHHPDYGTGCLRALTGGRQDGLLEPMDDCTRGSLFHLEPAGAAGAGRYVLRVGGRGCVGIRDGDPTAGAEALISPCVPGGPAFVIEPAP